MFSYSLIITKRLLDTYYKIEAIILIVISVLQSFFTEGQIIKDSVIGYLGILFEKLLHILKLIFLSGP
jgi:hypothetical protein